MLSRSLITRSFVGLIAGFVILRVVVVEADEEAIEYGVDVSYPMHHKEVTKNYPWLPHNNDPWLHVPYELRNKPIQPLGDRQNFYDKSIEGCVEYYGGAQSGDGRRCLTNELIRVQMSLRQPKSVVNYTETGYTKIRAPQEVMDLLTGFWEKNKHKARAEKWAKGNTYTNHWQRPTKLVSVEDRNMEGAGFVLKQSVWDAARNTIEEWTGQRLAECSLYGIRVYEEGAVLATHVDRLPLVSSAIINVDQDVDEPWPLEVIGHDGKAHNITMEPGDLVLYESHSVLHGRPFPLKGRFMANIFVHFEPVGPLSGPERGVYRDDLPPYLIPGSEEERIWRNQNPQGWKATRGFQYEEGRTEAHLSAGDGDSRSLKKILDNNKNLVNAKDNNGWTPLHEAVRSRCFDCVMDLIQRGADVNARTIDGSSPLFYSKYFHPKRSHNNHISHHLQKYGAIELGPEL